MTLESVEVRVQQLLEQLDPGDSPAARLLFGDCPRGSRVAVLAGSFNPPTRAHLGLAEAALATGRFDRLLFALALRTINKERNVGATLAERCAMVAALVKIEPRFAVVVTNRGLYLDQAEAIQQAVAPRDLAFIVGFDKIVQIVDPRYYVDRDAALGDLFARVRFLVAPRDGGGRADLDYLFGQAEHRAFRERVQYLPLPQLGGQEQRLSSTQVRELIARGEDVAWAMPQAVLPILTQIAGYSRQSAAGE
ncbi:MAG: nicotinate-nicotinamide nucleotide adenylyltransferase [Chloroflexota bacterium]